MELFRKRKNFYIVALSLLILMFAFPLTTFGQSPTAPPPYTPLVDLPNVTYDSKNIGGYLAGIFNFFLGLTALFAVVAISYGGIQYITTDAIQGKSDGKAKITRALLGLLLALIAYIILYTINPDLLDFNFDPAGSASGVAPPGGGGPSIGG